MLAGAPEIGLHDYLDCLNVRSDDPVDISDCFDDPRQMHHWQRQTRRVMTEMAGFLRWIDDWFRPHPGTVHACLPQTVGFAAGQRIARIHRKWRTRLFILTLLTLSGPAADMLLYTTVPWLYDTYAPVVCQRNYNYLRDMETVVAHDHLFRFGAWRKGKVYVTETTGDRIRRLAAYEIRFFRQLADEA